MEKVQNKYENKYEVVMIFNLADGEESAKALGERFKNLIEEHGTMDEVEEWGRRRLAYPIEDEIEGYYILAKFTSEPSFPIELERVLGITDGVLRSMVIRLEQTV